MIEPKWNGCGNEAIFLFLPAGWHGSHQLQPSSLQDSNSHFGNMPPAIPLRVSNYFGLQSLFGKCLNIGWMSSKPAFMSWRFFTEAEWLKTGRWQDLSRCF